MAQSVIFLFNRAWKQLSRIERKQVQTALVSELPDADGKFNPNHRAILHRRSKDCNDCRWEVMLVETARMGKSKLCHTFHKETKRIPKRSIRRQPMLPFDR